MHGWRPSFICIVVFLYFLFASLWICILYNKKISYCSGHFCTEYIAEHGKTHKILIIIIIMLVMMKVLFEKWPTARQVTFFPFPISNCSDLLLTFPLNIFDISPQTCSFQSCSCFKLILWQDLLCIAKGDHWKCVHFEKCCHTYKYNYKYLHICKSWFAGFLLFTTFFEKIKIKKKI